MRNICLKFLTVLAAVSAYTSFTTADHAAIRRHARYKHEGFIYS